MTTEKIPNLWDEKIAAGLDGPGLLLYRSNLLGSDLRVTNFGGGNTSAKLAATDPLTGENVTTMWVKGSGGDLGSMKLDGFATLYLDKLLGLKKIYRGLAHEDEMVAKFNHCTFNLNPRAASIDTPLHAFVPHLHVDHMHPDAVIALAAARDSKRLTAELFGNEMGWLPWQRPGFDLGLKIGQMASDHPEYKGVILAGHGLFTWGKTARECYDTTIEMINRAAAWLAANVKKPAFGGAKTSTLPAAAQQAAIERLMTAIRARISGAAHSSSAAAAHPSSAAAFTYAAAQQGFKVGHVSTAPEVMEFVNAKDLARLVPLGTSCPDHFLRTKICPLIVPADADDATLDKLIGDYRDTYAAYHQRCARPHSPKMRDPNPVIYLVPGVGLLSFAKDKATARIAAEFYINAINVMRGAEGVNEYVGLPEQEAFDIEYWLLEEAKLQRMPKAKSLQGRVAFITGGSGGIGLATAHRLLGEGAAVMIADIDGKSNEQAVAALGQKYGMDNVKSVVVDVTIEAAVDQAMAATVREFGGIDILVSGAGIASASAIEDTSLALWQRNMDILATGYFLVARAAYRVMKAQKCGGSIVFIASKNGLAASPGAAAYCTAKAAELHLARCLALEGAAYGIRVNSVNPDAVLRGSKIWQSEWREQRAASNKVATDELEEVYRQRSLLKLSVYPEDIAEAVYYLASDASAKSTGNIINVDAGNAMSFTR